MMLSFIFSSPEDRNRTSDRNAMVSINSDYNFKQDVTPSSKSFELVFNVTVTGYSTVCLDTGDGGDVWHLCRAGIPGCKL